MCLLSFLHLEEFCLLILRENKKLLLQKVLHVEKRMLKVLKLEIEFIIRKNIDGPKRTN